MKLVPRISKDYGAKYRVSIVGYRNGPRVFINDNEYKSSMSMPLAVFSEILNDRDEFQARSQKLTVQKQATKRHLVEKENKPHAKKLRADDVLKCRIVKIGDNMWASSTHMAPTQVPSTPATSALHPLEPNTPPSSFHLLSSSTHMAPTQVLSTPATSALHPLQQSTAPSSFHPLSSSTRMAPTQVLSTPATSALLPWSSSTRMAPTQVLSTPAPSSFHLWSSSTRMAPTQVLSTPAPSSFHPWTSSTRMAPTQVPPTQTSSVSLPPQSILEKLLTTPTTSAVHAFPSYGHTTHAQVLQTPATSMVPQVLQPIPVLSPEYSTITTPEQYDRDNIFEQFDSTKVSSIDFCDAMFD